MAVMTQDSRFEKAQEIKKERSEVTMCEVLDKIVKEGEQRGEQRGKISILLEEGYSNEDIAERLHLSIKDVETIIASRQ